jgi:surface antigen
MKIKKWAYLLFGLIFIGFCGSNLYNKYFKKPGYSIGEPMDSLNGIYIYYNGPGNNISGRSITPDHYNLGMKYQCVEFVKRYYYLHYHHRMPETYGDAKDFFDDTIGDGQTNITRDLIQYRNPGSARPKEGDIVVFGSTPVNKFGHVAIISEVMGHRIEIIQQNKAKTRETYYMMKRKSGWYIMNKRVLGWLRKNN